VEDLESEEQSPESMLMGAVTSEGAAERAEREVLVPWLRHVWDTFRNVLENIRYVPRLEALYHATVVKAMAFCRSYNRGAEFRKLCAMLRNHLLAQRRSQDNNGITMSAEQVERHLLTRFVQLERCADLALWAEGFRTVEDISGIMALSPVPPKAQLMATYFEKLARIFWVSENYLFHAFAWYRFFNLSYAQNKGLSEDDRRNMASAVVLAALAIPVYASGTGTSAAYNTEAGAGGAQVTEYANERSKKAKLAVLLKDSVVPSREVLVAEILAKGVLRVARPEVAALFALLEGEFNPLSLISRAAPTLANLRAATTPTLAAAGTLSSAGAAAAHSLSQYVPNLERLVVFRMLQQVGGVYSTMRLTTLRALLADLTIPFADVEKLLVRAVKNGLLAMRLNHRDGYLRVNDEALETSALRTQLVALSARLHAVVATMSAAAPPPVAALGAAGVLEKRRAAVFDLARTTLEAHRRGIMTRLHSIEKSKETNERMVQTRQLEVRQDCTNHHRATPHTHEYARLQQWAICRWRYYAGGVAAPLPVLYRTLATAAHPPHRSDTARFTPRDRAPFTTVLHLLFPILTAAGAAMLLCNCNAATHVVAHTHAHPRRRRPRRRRMMRRRRLRSRHASWQERLAGGVARAWWWGVQASPREHKHF